MSIAYDASVIEKFAARLYRRAAVIVFQYSVLGALVVVVVAVAALALLQRTGVGTPELVIAGAIGALIGFLVGREKSFNLRLQAQTALCHVQIEKNTRPTAAASVIAS